MSSVDEDYFYYRDVATGRASDNGVEPNNNNEVHAAASRRVSSYSSPLAGIFPDTFDDKDSYSANVPASELAACFAIAQRNLGNNN